MRIKIRTKVNATIKEVKAGFTEDLFTSLNPPFPPVKVRQFDGCNAGDKVVLELNFFLFSQLWISNIIEDNESEMQWYFIDLGEKLPFFLKNWRHIHEVNTDAEGSIILDNISYSTGLILTDFLLYPLLWGQFFYRKAIYKKWFNR